MILKISLLFKRILIAALVILGTACIVTTTVHCVKGHENKSDKAETVINKEPKLPNEQENYIPYVPREEDLGNTVRKHTQTKSYEGENKYWGVQTYTGIPGIEGGKGFSTVPALLEENENTAKNIVLGFKPSDKIEDIFDKYRSSIEEKNEFHSRDLLPFQLVDLNDNKANTIYYGMPRELEQDVMDKNGLKLAYNYNVTYKDGKQVAWNFYEKEINEDLGKRSTLVQINFESNDISKDDKYQLHKIPLGNSLPEDFVDMLSNLETDDLNVLRDLGLELKV